jgi:hypothetical protein
MSMRSSLSRGFWDRTGQSSRRQSRRQSASPSPNPENRPVNNIRNRNATPQTPQTPQSLAARRRWRAAGQMVRAVTALQSGANVASVDRAFRLLDQKDVDVDLRVAKFAFGHINSTAANILAQAGMVFLGDPSSYILHPTLLRGASVTRGAGVAANFCREHVPDMIKRIASKAAELTLVRTGLSVASAARKASNVLGQVVVKTCGLPIQAARPGAAVALAVRLSPNRINVPVGKLKRLVQVALALVTFQQLKEQKGPALHATHTVVVLELVLGGLLDALIRKWERDILRGRAQLPASAQVFAWLLDAPTYVKDALKMLLTPSSTSRGSSKLTNEVVRYIASRAGGTERRAIVAVAAHFASTLKPTRGAISSLNLRPRRSSRRASISANLAKRAFNRLEVPDAALSALERQLAPRTPDPQNRPRR